MLIYVGFLVGPWLNLNENLLNWSNNPKNNSKHKFYSTTAIARAIQLIWSDIFEHLNWIVSITPFEQRANDEKEKIRQIEWN